MPDLLEPPPADSPPARAVHSAGVGPGGAGVTIPADALVEFSAFGEWVRGEDFPEFGRVDWAGGRVEPDLMPESLVFHGLPKANVVAVLVNRVLADGLGRGCVGRTRVSSPPGAEPAVSCEPDFAFLSYDTVRSGRVTLIPKADRDGEFTEVVGPPDLVVEIVSDSSVRKDTVELPAGLFALGVTEYWLIDARREEPTLAVQARGADRFEPVPAGPDGFAASAVLGRGYRLTAAPAPDGLRQVRLLESPPSPPKPSHA